MPRTVIVLNSAGIKELLNDPGVREEPTRRAEHVLARAKDTAPVVSGDYAESLHIKQATTDRAVVRVVADSDHAVYVQAHTGHLCHGRWTPPETPRPVHHARSASRQRSVGGIVMSGDSSLSATTARPALTFVLIHGFWHYGELWDQVANALRWSGHKVHTPTIAGFGRKPALAADPDDQAGDAPVSPAENQQRWGFAAQTNRPDHRRAT
jgi:hypothetical protein